MAKAPKIPKTPYRPPDDHDEEQARERERNRRGRMRGAASTILSARTQTGGKTGMTAATTLGGGSSAAAV